ncbi:ABC transporter permease [Sulfidibacter corallicola]
MLRNIFLKGLGFAGFMLSIWLAWHLIISIFAPPAWLFPSPSMVYQRFTELWEVEALQPHLRITATEIVIGYLLGIAGALLSGYPISQIRLLEKVLTPYLIAANSVPLVAFAPLLILWLGNGIEAKIVVAALIVFFPATISTITGFHAQSPIYKRLMRSLRASKLQRFLYLELPSAVPGILAGMKIGAPLAVVGAVVGEFLGTGLGLGHLILEANGLMDTPQLFVAIILLGMIGIVFYMLIMALEQILLGPWHNKKRR